MFNWFSALRTWLANRWWHLRKRYYVYRGIDLNTWPYEQAMPQPRLGIEETRRKVRAAPTITRSEMKAHAAEVTAAYERAMMCSAEDWSKMTLPMSPPARVVPDPQPENSVNNNLVLGTETRYI